MMKRLMIWVIFFCMIFSSCLADGFRVFDNADIFTTEEEALLEEQIAQYRMETKTDFCVLTTDDFLGRNNQLEIAELFLYSCDIGLGPSKDGVVFYLDMYHRIPAVCTSGIMTTMLSGITLDAFFSSSYSYLKNNEFYDGTNECINFSKQLVLDYWAKELQP